MHNRPSLIITPSIGCFTNQDGDIQHYICACEVTLETAGLTQSAINALPSALPRANNINLHVTQLSNKKVQIKIDYRRDCIHILHTMEWLQQKTFLSQLCKVLNIKDSNATQETIILLAKKIQTSFNHILSNAKWLALTQQLTSIKFMLTQDEASTMVKLIDNNALASLMNQIKEADSHLNDLIALCNQKMNTNDPHETILWQTIATTITQEKKRLEKAASDIEIKKSPYVFNTLLEKNHCSEEKILALLYHKQQRESLLWLVKQTIYEIKDAHLLSPTTLNQLIEKIKQPDYHCDNGIQLLNTIKKMKPLLNPELLSIIIQNNTMNHSCQSRLQGNGLQDVVQTDAQLRWAYASQYAIDWAKKEFSMDHSLTGIIAFLATFRQQVAINERVSYAKEFGLYRTRLSGDIFNNTEYSATSPAILPDLVTLTKNTLLHCKKKYQQHRSSSTSSFFTSSANKKTIITLEIAGLSLPTRSIEFFADNDIGTEFSALPEKDYRHILQALDKEYVAPIQFPQLSQEEKIDLVGALTYYLCVLYPYKRGSSAIMQWTINGLLQHTFGITVGQICMGPNLDIPFDVYAHLTGNLDDYKKEFARVIRLKLAPILSQEKRLTT